MKYFCLNFIYLNSFIQDLPAKEEKRILNFWKLVYPEYEGKHSKFYPELSLAEMVLKICSYIHLNIICVAMKS